MSQSLLILGRQPAIARAELESLFGAEALQVISDQAVIVNKDPATVNIDRLGGTIKVAKLLTVLDFTDWRKLSDYLVEQVPKHTCCIGPGKLTFGISIYGVKANQKAIERTALAVKKAVRASDNRPVRVVPTKGTELSSAQVLHNKMYEQPFGMELIFVQQGSRVYLAQTWGVQNIDAYAARDQARPKRDARVGMLPPKLAQTIVNLAVGNTAGDTEMIEKEVLDPFCGTGVILQEALLMGYEVYGTDIEPRLVEYTKENLAWLDTKQHVYAQLPRVEVGDATSFTWLPTPGTIACETYLGRPFAQQPDPETLKQVMSDVNTIHKKFLDNVARQTVAGFRMCIAIPAWHINGTFKHLPILDHLTDMGYTLVSFKHADDKDLIYHREGQIVGRELVTLIRK